MLVAILYFMDMSIMSLDNESFITTETILSFRLVVLGGITKCQPLSHSRTIYQVECFGNQGENAKCKFSVVVKKWSE